MNPTGAATPRVVVLCGFMGTGKTLVGRILAERLSVPFIDTDALIERRAGKTVTEIFEQDGEVAFRMLEHDVIAALDPPDSVVATGGGALMDKRSRERLARLGLCVHLDAPFDAIAERIVGAPGRPLAATSRRQLHSLWEARRPVYEELPFRVDTSLRTPMEAAADIETFVASGGTAFNLRVNARPLPGIGTDVFSDASRVVVRRGCRHDAGQQVRKLGSTRCVVLAPQNIADLYLQDLAASLDAAGVQWEHIPLADGDTHKTWEQTGNLLDALAAHGASRDTTVITLGGGVTGDLGGFVAATCMRGLPWINIPTTLLAQVDASIGGKVGVNSARAKNIAGTIYQPHVVLADANVLVTLSPDTLADGYAEVIKTAMIGDARMFDRLVRAAADKTTPSDPALLDDAIRACMMVKGRIVETDPFERDRRRVLNLGHTAGHALETASNHSLSHGQAVAIGLVTALTIGVDREVAGRDYLETVRTLIHWAGLPDRAPGIDEDPLRAALKLDKKRRQDGITFILPHSPGNISIVTDVSEDELLRAIPR